MPLNRRELGLAPRVCAARLRTHPCHLLLQRSLTLTEYSQLECLGQARIGPSADFFFRSMPTANAEGLQRTRWGGIEKASMRRVAGCFSIGGHRRLRWM